MLFDGLFFLLKTGILFGMNYFKNQHITEKHLTKLKSVYM